MNMIRLQQPLRADLLFQVGEEYGRGFKLMSC
jgi:hypothetical protein